MSTQYTIQSNQGLQYGPMEIEELKNLIQDGRIKPMTMVYSSENGRWQVAALLPEIKEFLQHRHPSQTILMKYGSAKGSVMERLSRSRLFRRKKTVLDESQPPQTDSPAPPTGEQYHVRAGDGVEYGPINFDQLNEMIREGKIRATTMVYVHSTVRWHLAASLPEIRVLLRKFKTDDESVLDRIRAMSTVAPGLKMRASTVRFRIKIPLWKRLFGSK